MYFISHFCSDVKYIHMRYWLKIIKAMIVRRFKFKRIDIGLAKIRNRNEKKRKKKHFLPLFSFSSQVVLLNICLSFSKEMDKLAVFVPNVIFMTATLSDTWHNGSLMPGKFQHIILKQKEDIAHGKFGQEMVSWQYYKNT